MDRRKEALRGQLSCWSMQLGETTGKHQRTCGGLALGCGRSEHAVNGIDRCATSYTRPWIGRKVHLRGQHRMEHTPGRRDYPQTAPTFNDLVLADSPTDRHEVGLVGTPRCHCTA